ncbi:MAG: ABC transporter ATP-binding protein [Bacillota bacterium]
MELLTDTSFRKLLTIVKEFKWLFVVVVLTQWLSAHLALWFADVTRQFFSAAPSFEGNILNSILLILLVVIVLRWITYFFSNWLRELLNETVLFQLRYKVLSHLQSLKMAFHDNTHSSVSQNILFQEIDTAKQFIVRDLINLFTLPYVFLIIVFYLTTVHPLLGVLAFCVGPLQFLSTFLWRKKFQKSVAERNEASKNVIQHIGETLGGIRELKINQLEISYSSRFKKLCNHGIKAWSNFYRIAFIREIAKDVPYQVGYWFGIALGGIFLIRGQIDIGGMVAFITLLEKVSRPFVTLTDAASNLQQSAAGAQKLYEVLSMESEDRYTGTPLTPRSPSISFSDVSFSYNSNYPIISKFNLVIPSGTSLALVGPSGAGKSTLIKLLYRFYSIQSGSIKLNDSSIESYSINTIRQSTALVSQDVFIFDGTILDNIKISKPEAAMEDIIEAARSAGIYNFIKELPNGLYTKVGERGIQLSQGQKQRIALARAALKKARLLILDEPTSALDIESEEHIITSLKEWAYDCTTIIIAHRLSTIQNADLVAFMESGRIIEFGNPSELLGGNGRFSEYVKKSAFDPYAHHMGGNRL